MNDNPVDAYIAEIANVRNAAHCIMEYASNHGDKNPEEITWSDVGTAEHIYNKLIEIATECGIDVKRI